MPSRDDRRANEISFVGIYQAPASVPLPTRLPRRRRVKNVERLTTCLIHKPKHNGDALKKSSSSHATFVTLGGQETAPMYAVKSGQQARRQNLQVCQRQNQHFYTEEEQTNLLSVHLPIKEKRVELSSVLYNASTQVSLSCRKKFKESSRSNSSSNTSTTTSIVYSEESASYENKTRRRKKTTGSLSALNSWHISYVSGEFSTSPRRPLPRRGSNTMTECC